MKIDNMVEYGDQDRSGAKRAFQHRATARMGRKATTGSGMVVKGYWPLYLL